MITAAEALRLPSAKLTDEERSAVALIMAEIDTYVRANMKHHGCDIRIPDPRQTVMAEVNQLLKAKSWNPKWAAIIEKGAISNMQTIAGYILTIAPSDEAYKAADEPIKA